MNGVRRSRDNPQAPTRAGVARVAARPNVHIDIQKLSLHGFSQREQQSFMRALSRALERQAAAKQDWSAVTAQSLQSLPALQARAGSTPEDSARLLASEIFARLANPAERGHG